MFRSSPSVHRFLPLTFRLLLPGSPVMTQEAKNTLVHYGNNAELPWIKIFDTSLRVAAMDAEA